ncbi:MAG: AtpZ/AtpI family protein [Deltaproteobacteria bacterium]|jgi:ATP synthase protein I|nr:MAG: AtpZ/AtpI family protein [Deltaproteobacteria bacterium]
MENKRKLFRLIGRYSTIGLEMVISVVIGILFGWWLDRLFNTKPWLTIVFMLFGIAAGFRSLFKLLKDIKKDDGINQE